MGNIIDILVPEVSVLRIAGREYKLGLLSARKVIRLLRVFGRLSAKITAEAKDKIAKSENNVTDFFTIFELLEDSEIAEIVGILIDETDIEFIKTNIVNNITALTEILAIVCEKNDFGKLLRNLTRTAKIINLTQN